MRCNLMFLHSIILILLVCIALALFTAACSNKNNTQDDAALSSIMEDITGSDYAVSPVPGDSTTVSHEKDDESISANNPTTDETMSITWDMFWAYGKRKNTIPSESRIAQTINEHFNVLLDSIVYTGSEPWTYQEQLIKENNLPDIFTAHVAEEVFLEADVIRKIPWDMIEQNMPRYVQMLKMDKDYYEYFSTGQADDHWLSSMQVNSSMLNTYSVYRLDWLETIGVVPKGDVVEIANNVYFTDTAFTLDEFKDIVLEFGNIKNMRKFHIKGNERNWALSLPGDKFDWFRTSPLLGLWGINLSNMDMNGNAVYWYNSEAFYTYMEFMLWLKDQDVLYNGPYANDYVLDGNVGWWSESIDSLFYEEGLDMYLKFNPEAKVLLTPPEIGPAGLQGVPDLYGASNIKFASSSGSFLINVNVSNEKLAVILQIFDAISFDPELYVMTHYGFEGVDYEWAGVPYDSYVIPNPQSTECTGLFASQVLDENAGKNIYNFPHEALYRFAVSEAAQKMLLGPYKQDINGVYLSNNESLQETYPFGVLFDIAVEYYADVMSGVKDLRYTWDAYNDELMANGMGYWNDLFNKYPDVDVR